MTAPPDRCQSPNGAAVVAKTREAVLFALECPVDFMGSDSSQDIAQAVFDAADEGNPLIVIASGGRRVVMVPQPVEESA